MCGPLPLNHLCRTVGAVPDRTICRRACAAGSRRSRRICRRAAPPAAATRRGAKPDAAARRATRQPCRPPGVYTYATTRLRAVQRGDLAAGTRYPRARRSPYRRGGCGCRRALEPRPERGARRRRSTASRPAAARLHALVDVARVLRPAVPPALPCRGPVVPARATAADRSAGPTAAAALGPPSSARSAWSGASGCESSGKRVPPVRRARPRAVRGRDRGASTIDSWLSRRDGLVAAPRGAQRDSSRSEATRRSVSLKRVARTRAVRRSPLRG